MANAVITVLEADGTTQTDVTVLDVGRQAAATSKSVAASTEDKAVLDAIAASVAAATPAGTNNIGDVDILSVVPGTGATALGKAEDAAHTTGDVGVMLLGVRNDAGTTLAGTDGDYIPPSFDANGALRVTGGGGGTEYTEDVAAAADPVGQMLVAVRRDTLSASEVSADGDNIALKANSLGQLHTSGSYKEDDAHASGDWGKVVLARRIDAAASSAGSNGDYTTINSDATGRLWIRDTEIITALTDASASLGHNATVTVTRPSNTNTYGAGDVLGPTGAGTASMEFTSMGVSGGCVMITSVSLMRHVAALISGETSYTLHLYNVTQPGAQVDENTWSLVSGDRTAYLGHIDIGTPIARVATLYVEVNGLNKPVKLAGTSIFGVLVTNGSYVAASASVLAVTLNTVDM